MCYEQVSSEEYLLGVLNEEQILISGEMGSEIMQEKEKKLKNIKNLEVI